MTTLKGEEAIQYHSDLRQKLDEIIGEIKRVETKEKGGKKPRFEEVLNIFKTAIMYHTLAFEIFADIDKGRDEIARGKIDKLRQMIRVLNMDNPYTQSARRFLNNCAPNTDLELATLKFNLHYSSKP